MCGPLESHSGKFSALVGCNYLLGLIVILVVIMFASRRLPDKTIHTFLDKYFLQLLLLWNCMLSSGRIRSVAGVCIHISTKQALSQSFLNEQFCRVMKIKIYIYTDTFCPQANNLILTFGALRWEHGSSLDIAWASLNLLITCKIHAFKCPPFPQNC